MLCANNLKHYVFSFRLCSGICFAAALVLTSCFIIPPKTETPETKAPLEILPEGDDGINFDSLPLTVQKYLSSIRKAFKEKNQDFLISQGESYYESDMRSKYPKAQYLALLYRVGPYSKDSTWQLPAYQIDINTIHDLQWVEFVDKGPVLLVEAKIITNDFKTIPCSIMLLWRLNEPKVMGTYP